MNLDTSKLIECIDWKGIDKNQITLNVDGEKLRETIYNELHVTIKKHHENSIGLYSNGKLFINITPNKLFPEETCKQIATDIQYTLNNRIKSKLNLK